MSNIPQRADVVIIGGGIIGCSITYHLTKIGISDVVLLERKQLTCGTTWHAAGLVPQLRATRTLTELAKYTSELLHSLEAETGQATGFLQNGSVAVALSDARLEQFQRTGAMGRAFGVHVDFLSPAEVLDKYPLLDGKGPTTARPIRSTRHRLTLKAPSSVVQKCSRTRRSPTSWSRTAARSA